LYYLEGSMPDQETRERVREDAREGKSPSTQAGEFVREEIHHIREGKHGAASTKQAIAIGLSKARRAGVDPGPPKRASAKVRKQARTESANRTKRAKPSTRRSRASLKALKRKGTAAASPAALSKQAKRSAKARPKRERSAQAKRAARTRRRM
jgi:hypothetical protein